MKNNSLNLGQFLEKCYVVHKAKLLVKGYKQQYGVDYKEVFAPVAWLETVKLLILSAAQMKRKLL